MSEKIRGISPLKGWWEQYCERFIHRIGWFFPIWLISWIVNLLYYPTITNPIKVETFSRVSLLPLGWACVWYVVLCLIKPNRLFRVCALIVVGVYLITSLIDLFLFEVYGRIFDEAIALIFLSTNHTEAEEFWATKVSLSSILMPLGYVSIVILLSWVSGKLLGRLRGAIRSIIVGAIAIIALVSLFGVYPLLVLRYWPGQTAVAVLTSPERLCRGIQIAVHDAGVIQRQLEQLEETNVAPIFSQDTLPPHNVVLVIGESLRPDFMSLYGYKRETTPTLDSLNKQGDILLFDDVTSSASYTNASVANMLSTYTLDQAGRWYDTPLLNQLVANAGYYTYWVSMQESHGVYIALIASIARLSDELKYLKGVDGNVLSVLKSKTDLLGKSRRNLFQVCHLYGSHEKYASRYPQDYARFKPEDMSEYPEDRQKELSSQYLNTVYYNDYVVSEIIKRYKDEPTLLIYLSDHGQAIYDDPDNPKLAGHSLSVPGVRVPMLCYVSPSLRTAAPQIVERIKRGLHRPIMTDALATSILGILGIKSDDYNPKYDFTSEEYDEYRERRIVDGGKTIVVNPLKK